MEEFIETHTLYQIATKFGYEGKPYNLNRYRPFLPFFKDRMAQTRVFKTGRQLGKTTCLGATSHARAMITPGFRIITVQPIEKQAKDYSYYRLDEFKRNSPIIKNMITRDNWSRKGYTNGSSQLIEYILNNVGRVQGISGDMANLDEYQDYDSSVMPIFLSCLAASDYELMQITGVPKTTTNILEEEWQNSSQAEWVTPCPHCSKENMASLQEDLMDMIGPEGPICASCGKPIDPSSEDCFYLHTNPSKTTTREGYHVPQIIMPLHFDSVGNNKWYQIMDSLKGPKSWDVGKFMNERLGESYDTGKVVLSKKDVQKCCTLDLPDMVSINKLIKEKKYSLIFNGVDWGGYGKQELSRTAIVSIGVKPIDTGLLIDFLYYKIFDKSMSDHEMIDSICGTVNKFQIDPKKKVVLHDLGAGQIYHEDLTRDLNIPPGQVIGTELFLDPDKDVIIPKSPDNYRPKAYYQLNKTKAVMLLVKAIKHQKTNFDSWERFEGPAKDFLSVELEESKHTIKSSVLRVQRTANRSDDLLMAAIQAFHGALYRFSAYGGFFDPETLNY